MADGPFRFQQGAGQFFFNQQNHLPRNLQRTGSPVTNGRVGFPNPDAPSPNRSPGPQSPAHNPFSMYNQAHAQQGQHAMLNGNSHQRFAMQMNLAKFQQQHQTHQHQNHQHPQHQDHSAHGAHGANFGNHQHTMSGGLTNATPHFAGNHLQNGTPGSVHSSLSKPPNEHWALQLQYAQHAREMTMSHSHARNHPSTNKSIVSGQTNGIVKEEKEERHRAAKDSDKDDGQIWKALDLGGQNLKVLSPALFDYTFLTKLYLNYNKLTFVSPAIGKLRNLRELDLSLNELRTLPPEIGMLVNLRELLLFDNNIETLPYEMGSLYQLEMLGIEGNPSLDEQMKNIVVEHGTTELIKYLREQAPGPEPPAERDWIVLDDTPVTPEDKFMVLSYNILCDRMATQSHYGYTPSAALAWEHRRDLILQELRARESDIICLQEIDSESYNEYFRGSLAHDDYKGVFWPKARARTMTEREAKLVDGCAIFYKNSKFILLDKQLIDFGNLAINRPDMKGEHDIFNRVMPRDNIAVAAFLENRQTGARLIVVNAHVYWDPAFKDVKVVQAAILMEQIQKLAEKYVGWPPCTDKAPYRYANGDKEGESEPEPPPEPAPSQTYSKVEQIPLVLCGDFNSTPDSGVYELIAHGLLSNDHSDLGTYNYGHFTKNGMSHPFALKSSYSNIGELSFTNYTPGFTGVIDYIWYSTTALNATGLLGEVDREYMQRVPGFPNYHFPSDHLALLAEFTFKGRKEKKAAVEPDFGPQRERR
ncbi:glucose-repressible alcohol dehydrogenase-like protein transcriptional effector [Phyllosticta capitalensis]